MSGYTNVSTLVKEDGEKSRTVDWLSPLKGTGFGRVPHLLYDHAADLKLDEKHLAFIGCLFRFAWLGVARPSYALLSGMLGISVKSVERRLANLKRLGLVKVVRSRRADGALGVNTIDLRPLIREIAALSRQSGTDKAQGRHQHLTAVRRAQRCVDHTSQVSGGPYVTGDGTEEDFEFLGKESNNQDTHTRAERGVSGNTRPFSEDERTQTQGITSLIEGWVAWNRRFPSVRASDTTLGRQIAAAVRLLGEGVVREVWRQARNGDCDFHFGGVGGGGVHRPAHPGVFWRMIREIRKWSASTPFQVRAVFGPIWTARCEMADAGFSHREALEMRDRVWPGIDRGDRPLGEYIALIEDALEVPAG